MDQYIKGAFVIISDQGLVCKPGLVASYSKGSGKIIEELPTAFSYFLMVESLSGSGITRYKRGKG